MAKSHIIPNSFLQRHTDAPFVEWDGIRSRKLYTGWYDQNILTDEGEELFKVIDDAAAKCFINNGYTYRKRRDPINPTKLVDDFIPGKLYQIKNVKSTQIRLFGLSLLWRAAVSTLPAFKQVKLSAKDLADLGSRILLGDPGAYTEFPVLFGLMSGATELTKIGPFQLTDLPFYRFFLDGVFCYVSPTKQIEDAGQYGNWLAGADDNLINMICFDSATAAQDRYTVESAKELRQRQGNPFRGLDKAIARRRK